MNVKRLFLYSVFPCSLMFALTACKSSSGDAPLRHDETGGSAGAGSDGAGGAGGAPTGGSESGGTGNAAGMGGDDAGTGGTDSSVRGKVVDGSGKGVSGALVVLAGEKYTTNADGEFEAKDVGDTYDLLVSTEDSSKRVNVWKNATTRSPVARVFVSAQIPHVTVKGAISGGAGLPNAEGTVTMVGLDCNDGRREAAKVVTAADFEVSALQAEWGTSTCRLMALEGKGTEYGYSEYTAFASREITLKSLDILEEQDLALEPVTETTKVSVRHDYSTSPDTMSIYWGPFPAAYEYSFSNSDVRMWEATVPNLSTAVWAGLTTNGHVLSRRALGSTFLLLDWQEGMWGLVPQKDAVVAPSAEFSGTVSSFLDPGIYEFDFTLASGDVLVLHTNSPKFTIPDLSEVGIELSGATKWTGTYATNATSVDTLLTENPLPDFSNMVQEASFVFEESAAP